MLRELLIGFSNALWNLGALSLQDREPDSFTCLAISFYSFFLGFGNAWVDKVRCLSFIFSSDFVTDLVCTNN